MDYIYIIISNVGMALMMIVVYIRYSRFRLSSAAEIRDLRKAVEKESQARNLAEEKLLNTTKTDIEKVEKLLLEIDDLRKEKEIEIRLRVEAEKQIALALLRAEDIQKRMDDWRLIQDAVMRDSKDAIVKVGNDLYKKLNDSYKIEVETNKNLIGRVTKNISEFVNKFSNLKSEEVSKKPSEEHAIKSVNHEHDEVTKKLILDLVSTMKAAGRMVNKDYFIPTNFDEQKAKLFLCEAAFISANKLYIIDFKSCRYLEDYNQTKLTNKASAELELQQKFDKYFSYLSNPKYLASILKVMSSTKVKFDKNNIVIIISSKSNLQVMKENHYYEKAMQQNLQMMNFDEVTNLIL